MESVPSQRVLGPAAREAERVLAAVRERSGRVVPSSPYHVPLEQVGLCEGQPAHLAVVLQLAQGVSELVVLDALVARGEVLQAHVALVAQLLSATPHPAAPPLHDVVRHRVLRFQLRLQQWIYRQEQHVSEQLVKNNMK